MDMFPNKQRRRSNLGRKNRQGQNPVRPNPVFQVPAIRGLARPRSAIKSYSSLTEAKPSAETLCAKKRLFLLSPQNQLSFDTPQEQSGTSKMGQWNQTYVLRQNSSNSLNETGVGELVKTPSPNFKEITIIEPHSSKKKIERPKSLGMSNYNKLILHEFAQLKKPVDPDDCPVKPPLPEHKQEAGPVYSKLTSHLKEKDYNLTINLSDKDDIDVKLRKLVLDPSEKKAASPNSSFVDNDELDSTNSFILAEQTIIDQNQTLTKSSPVRETVSASKSILKPSRNLEPVVEEDIESEEEDIVIVIEQHISNLNKMSVEIESMKRCLSSFLSKRKKRESRVENKENNATSSNIQNKDRWISDLKTENPGLLKTPKPLNKTVKKQSFPEQSIIWTPHSLSTVLTDQMDDLFE